MSCFNVLRLNEGTMIVMTNAELSLCLSLGVEDVRLGAACGALTPAQLSLIVNQIERHLNQLAAAYGVQRRRLSLYTPPQWTHGRFDPWLVRVSHQ